MYYQFTRILAILILALTNRAAAQEGYGLEFRAKNIMPEQRTSLVIPTVPLSNDYDYTLSFSLSFAPLSTSYFGYLFRFIDDREQNIDLIYNVHARALQIVTGNEFSGISYPMEPGTMARKWKNIRVNIGVNSHRLSLWVDKEKVGEVPLKLLPAKSGNLLFGANRDGSFRNIDLPPMRLRDIQWYRDDELQLHFPLAQHAGTRDTDLVKGKVAYTEHPVWLQPRYHNWQLAGTWQVKGNAALAFNNKAGTLYITGQHEVLQWNAGRREMQQQLLFQPTGAPQGNQTVFDEQHQRLYNYFPDSPQVAAYDPHQLRWSHALDSNPVTHFWHPTVFYSSYDSAIYQIGGYGDYQYKNLLRRYHPDTQQWDTPAVQGERFTPRYLSAVGMNSAGDTAYILGGYGSLNGEQLLNPHQLYDLTVLDIRHHRYTKIYTLPKPEHPYAFGGNLVIDAQQQAAYTLIYPNDRLQSAFRLMKTDLHHPRHELIGDTIAFPFVDVKSRATLYYCEQTGELLAVTSYSPDNKISEVKIYTLLLPVILPEITPVHAPWYMVLLSWKVLACLVMLLIVIWAEWRPFRIGNTVTTPDTRKEPVLLLPERMITSAPVLQPIHFIPDITPVEIPMPQEVIPEPAVNAIPAAPLQASIRLFGTFKVVDSSGKDISRQFSPLVKELFLLILLPNITDGQGITTARLTDILWPSMTQAAAKNNRSVNIAKLRSLLDKLGEYSLQKEKGRWILLADETQIKTDLLQWRQLPAFCQAPDQHLELLKGPLLEGLDYQWLDSYRAAICQEVISNMDEYLQHNHCQLPPARIVAICDCMLRFDPVCESAVMYKCKALAQQQQHASAHKLFLRFQEDYQEIYGEKYERKYAEMIAE
ncbi:hypothetical protein [Chitinophaga sp. Cy-1792]|uniref:hypothetical protein n=1 Tax=Chitinophaga sp. Cy-1792 TaxID=2608339 RepID=UPI001421D519|nr:hypothetical protein [Chitinophaga sp. Cy-1792]NIG56703.1 hypothetical protein [Chitinophaga sp. Cy-1792]